MSTQNYDATNARAVALTRGRVVADGTSLGNGATQTFDVACVSESELVIEVDMNGAANGDLAVEVRPFEADGTTVMPIAVPVTSQTGPTFVGGKVYYIGRFDVDGLEKVQVRITNNNAVPQTINRASWRFA